MLISLYVLISLYASQEKKEELSERKYVISEKFNCLIDELLLNTPFIKTLCPVLGPYFEVLSYEVVQSSLSYAC